MIIEVIAGYGIGLAYGIFWFKITHSSVFEAIYQQIASKINVTLAAFDTMLPSLIHLLALRPMETRQKQN